METWCWPRQSIVSGALAGALPYQSELTRKCCGKFLLFFWRALQTLVRSKKSVAFQAQTTQNFDSHHYSIWWMADCKNRCSACIWTMQRPRICCPSCVSPGWIGSNCVLLLFSYLPRWWPKEVGWYHDTVSPHVYHPKAASLWQGHPVSVERPCTPARGHSQLPGATGAMAQWANRKESGSFPFTSSKVTYMCLGNSRA